MSASPEEVRAVAREIIGMVFFALLAGVVGMTLLWDWLEARRKRKDRGE